MGLLRPVWKGRELSGEWEDIATVYRRFAIDEARGISPTYEDFAEAVAQSPPALRFLATLPPTRRQPNLLFAAVRHCAGLPSDASGLIDTITRLPEAIASVMLSRTTQTNEPGRCAVLLPILAQLPQPLALIEVGASAGLCLLPDRYTYDYCLETVTSEQDAPVVFPCRISGDVPIPGRLPQILWRAGLDLNPLDLFSEPDMAWLEALVWPEHSARAGRLRAAVALARTGPPRVVAGDLLTDLDALIAEAPTEATLVVFHTAVLAYVPQQADRDGFAASLSHSRAVWISNEAPGVFPTMARTARPPARHGDFLLAVNGQPVAWTGPHGQSIEWFGHRLPR